MTLIELKARLDAIFAKLPQLGEVSKSVIEDEYFEITIDGFPFFVGLGTMEVPALVPRECQAFELSIWEQIPGGYWHPPEDVDRELGQYRTIYQLAEKMIHVIMAQHLEGICEMVDELSPACPYCNDDPLFGMNGEGVRGGECPVCEL